MAWRQTKAEKFSLVDTPKIQQAIITLEHLGLNSLPDGEKAHIFVVELIDKSLCYALARDYGGFTLDPYWFWEAVQAMKQLPHPKMAHEWLEKGYL